MRLTFLRFGVGVLLAMLAAANLAAQVAGRGSLSGLVMDSSGAVVPGASVVLTNVATGDGSSSCPVGSTDCSTTHVTPHYVLEKESDPVVEVPKDKDKYNGPVASVPDHGSTAMLLGTAILALSITSRRVSNSLG